MSDSFGRWLVAKRGVRGEPGFVSQRELADRMGVDPTYVSQLEKRTTPPSYDTRQRIHDALGTTEDELIALGILSTRSARSGASEAIRGEPRPDPLVTLFSDFYGSLTPRQRGLMARLARGALQTFGIDDADDGSQRAHT